MGVIAIRRRATTVRALAGDVAWSVLPFVIGMFTIIRGAERIWLARLGGGVDLGDGGLRDLLVIGFASALGANLINNIPMIGALIGLLGNAAPSAREALALSALLGVNLGSIVTPFGSLATLLWLAIIRRKGEKLSSLGYMRVSIVIAPPTLLVATLALWLVAALMPASRRQSMVAPPPNLRAVRRHLAATYFPRGRRHRGRADDRTAWRDLRLSDHARGRTLLPAAPAGDRGVVRA